MFDATYLFVLALAALPLALTLLQGGGGNPIAFVHRLYRDAAYILAAILGIVCLEAALGISLENYWFEELGQSHRFWKELAAMLFGTAYLAGIIAFSGVIYLQGLALVYANIIPYPLLLGATAALVYLLVLLSRTVFRKLRMYSHGVVRPKP